MDKRNNPWFTAGPDLSLVDLAQPYGIGSIFVIQGATDFS